MAIYKPSNCVPFLTAQDLSQPFDISCELNTSNEIVTGYKIKILDNDNNIIFEGNKFDSINFGDYNNSGLNGSTLILPLTIRRDSIDGPVNNNTINIDSDGSFFVGDAIFEKSKFNNNYINQPYKWQITLAQGNIDAAEGVSDKYYDMEITFGEVLGSTPNRIQSYLSENVFKDYFIQLYDSNDKPLGDRAWIKSYDHTYGYLYPQKGVIASNLDKLGKTFEEAEYFKIFKFSNDPEVVASGSQVTLNTQKPMTKCGPSSSSVVWEAGKYPYYFKQVFENLSETPDITDGIPCNWFDDNAQGVLPVGSVIMVSKEGGDSGNSIYNGIFRLDSYNITEQKGLLTKRYTLTVQWLRSTPGDSWANLTNTVFQVLLGTNAGYRYQVQTNDVVGTINQTSVNFIEEQAIELYSEEKFGYNGNKDCGVIFKNSSNETYIRPFAGIMDGMRFNYLKKGANQYKSTEIKSVDTTVWKITTDAIGTLTSNDEITRGDTYKITSYFKESNENPFYAKVNPGLKVDSLQWETVDGKYVLDDTGIFKKCLKRYITVFGTFEGRNWVNYRYFLTDLSVGYLQKSDKIYRGSTEYSFYGLQNGHYYQIDWEVEDEYGKVWTKTELFMLNINITQTDFPFTATYDCDTQSVLLDFVRNGVVIPIPSIYETSYFKVKERIDGEQVWIPYMVSFENVKPEVYEYYQVREISKNSSTSYNVNYEQIGSTNDYILQLGDITGTIVYPQLMAYTKTKLDNSDETGDIPVPIDKDCTLNSQHILNAYFTGEVIRYELDTSPINNQPTHMTISVALKPVSYIDNNGEFVVNENRNKISLIITKKIGENGTPIVQEKFFELVNSSGSPIENNKWQKDNPVVSAWVKQGTTFSADYDYIEFGSIDNTGLENINIEQAYNSETNTGILFPINNSTTTGNNSCIWYDKQTSAYKQNNNTYINVFGDYNYWPSQEDETKYTWQDDNSGAILYNQVLNIKHTGREKVKNYKFTFNIVVKDYNSDWRTTLQNGETKQFIDTNVIAKAFVEVV